MPGPPRARRTLACAVAGVIVVLAIAAVVAVRAGAAEDWPDEAERLVRVLGIGKTATVADIGAGRGELTVEMARRVTGGRVFSTEVDRERLKDIAQAVEKAGLTNVTVLEAGARSTNLPEGCCDAIYMREVYHHFEDGPAMTADIYRALSAGGLLAVIDYPERDAFGGDCHCIAKDTLISQVTKQGFDVVTQEDRWAGTRYLVVFRKR